MNYLIFKNIFIAFLIILITQDSFSQKGKFELSNMNVTHPVTTFDRENSYVVIRNMILNNPSEFLFYKRIKNISNYYVGSKAYNSVNTSYSLEELQGMTQTCALHARSQAFVALMGIDDNNSFGNMDTIRKYYEFALRSLYRLEDHKKIFRKQHAKSSHLFRSEELIYALQAYDMLRAVKELYPTEFTDNYLDIIGGKLSSKRKDRHLQYFTRNLYRKSSQTFGIFINHDNHPLIVSAALGMSSIVLHDRGSKRKKQYKWQPIKWANAANWYINNRLWTNNTKRLCYDGGLSGYSEGPGYYLYAFQYLMPYFLTFNNAFENDIQMDFCLSDNNCETVRNYIYDPKYDVLANWFNAITLDNDVSPTYDDTNEGQMFSKSAVMRKSKLYNSSAKNYNDNKIDLDILVSKSQHSTPIHNPSTILHKSGNAIYRTEYEKPSISINGGRHYFHLLFEPENSRDNLNWWSTNLLPDYNPSTHEHDDMGSFMIYANETPLIFDPPYRDFSFHEEILQPYHHNALLIKHGDDYEGSSYKTDNAHVKYDYSNPRYRTLEVKYELDRLDVLNIKHKLGDAKRRIEVFNDEDPNTEYYYVITDIVTSIQNNSDIRMTINGNGNYTDISANGKHRFKWEVNDKGWGILVENSSLLSNPTYSTELGFSGLNGYSSHTRLNVDVTGKYAKFLTIYRPYLTSVGIERLANTTNTSDYSSSYIDSIGDDLQIHSHFIKHKQDTVINIYNPLGLDSSSYIRTDAQGGFLFLSHNNFNSKRCVSNTNFRKANIKSGSFLSYFDSTQIDYISTEYKSIEWDSVCFNKIITSYYELMSKFKYRGVTFIESDSCANVSYYLPDIEPGYELNVLDELTGEILPSHLNVSTKTITISFGKYMTQFIIQLKDPCLLACFFPPTSETIDSIFNFDNSTVEVLNDDLDIIQPNGYLNISNGSVMSICENVAFVNSDSLTLVGNEPKYFENYDNEGLLIGIDTIRSLSKIIVNNNSTLILDSNSVTNLNVNSQIVVKSGGTLLIKSGAKLLIGGINTNGVASILVEDSAYLCIEEGANISFYDLKDEYLEDNYLQVIFSPQPHASYEDVNIYSANGIFNSGGRFENSTCLSLCNIGVGNNPYGINNVNYGWSNFIKSKAEILGDSLFCTNEEIVFKANRTLNETEYYIKKYIYLDTISNFFLLDSSYNIGRVSNIYGRDEIGQHKIILIINNDCSYKDTIEHIYYVVDTPISIFILDTNNICSGYSKIIANGSNSSMGKHTWSVERISLYEEDNYDLEAELDEYDDEGDESGWSEEWTFNGSVDSGFTFPGFKFEGGYRYVVSLTVENSCGNSATSSDTIIVGTGVDLFYYDESTSKHVKSDTIIFHFIDPSLSAIKLRGFARQSSRVVWYDEYWNILLDIDPSNPYLDGSTLVINNNSNMKYYCVAIGPTCSDTDSVYIRVNSFNIISNAGTNIICKGDDIELTVYNSDQLSGAVYAWDNKYIDGDTTSHKVLFQPDSSTVVKLTIEYNSTIEIDYYNIIVQDTIQTDINISKIDSFICFTLDVDDINNISKIYWDFNDGSSIDSSLQPCHIFPNDTIYNYNICVTMINECHTVDTCFWININGMSERSVNNNNQNQISINSKNETRPYENNYIGKTIYFEGYPNPFNNYIYFRYQYDAIQSIYIYDLLGKLIDEIKINKNYTYYNSSALKPGIYIAKYNSETIKLVKH